MNTITGDSGMPGQPPTHLDLLVLLLVHYVRRILAADGREKISITAGNGRQAVKTASGLWRVLASLPTGRSRDRGPAQAEVLPGAQRRAVERARELAGRRRRSRRSPPTSG